jgi:DNA-binding TFAR19-related protein (PDSD5 family)
MLRDRLLAEDAEDALDALQEVGRSGTEVTEARLQEVLATLQTRRQP